MNRFLKTVWSINGVLLLILFTFVGILIVIEMFSQVRRSKPSQVIVGKELEKAKKEGLVLQGLSYDDPIKILGASGYILPIEVATYDQPKRQSSPFGRAFDSRNKLRVDVNYRNTMNVVFLTHDLKVASILLDKKGFIQSFRYPAGEEDDFQVADTAVRHIVYQIAFSDSNKDGVMNTDDNADLYLSSLDGADFHQATQGIDVIDFKFLTSSSLFLSYYKRDSTIAPEHKRKHFARYKISARKLEVLTEIDETLDNLEELLIK